MVLARSGVVAALLILLGLIACGNDPDIIFVQPTVTVTESSAADVAPPVAAPTAQPPTEPSSTYPFPGYPRVVQLTDVPKNMRWSIDSETAVAVAPGVWAENAPGTTLLDNALHGAWLGYCSSIEAAERQLDHDSGNMCW